MVPTDLLKAVALAAIAASQATKATMTITDSLAAEVLAYLTKHKADREAAALLDKWQALVHREAQARMQAGREATRDAHVMSEAAKPDA